MRRGIRFAAAASVIFLIVSQPGCGGGSSNTPTSGLEERAFVAVDITGSGSIQIINAEKDQISGSSISPLGAGAIAILPPAPQIMIAGPNSTTIEFNSGDNSVNILDNIKEAQVAKIGTIDCSTPSNCVFQFAAPTESIAASSDGKFIYAAIRSNSQVSIADLTGSSITVKNLPDVPGNCQTKGNCLPGAHRIVLSHNNAKLLVFNEDLTQFEIVNTSDSTVQTVTGLDHPTFGVFSSDDSKAYILNCGPECGGTQASVVTVDMSSLAVSQPVNVDAATVGIADTTNLYVAGSNPSSPGSGSATVLPLSSLSGGKQTKIGDGFHQVMSLFQGKLIVGARTCSTGCLSIVDPNAGTAIVDSPAAGQKQKGDVTSITNVTPRKVVYVAEGGELRIYDVTNGQEELTNNTPFIDIVGKVTSVLYVGPKTQ